MKYKGKDRDIVFDPKSSIKAIEVRCLDRKVRRFISVDKEVKCLECGRNFGVIEDDLILNKHLCGWGK